MPKPAEPDGAPTLRRDAERNRERIVDAAREVFGEQGVHAPVAEIARRAGVGVGTIYRRFPDRTELVEAAFIDRALTYRAALDEAVASEDPAAGLRGYLESLFDLQRSHRGVTDLLTVTLPASPRLAAIRSGLYNDQKALIARAEASGGTRPGLVPQDLILLLIAHAAVLRDAGDTVPELSFRFEALALDSIAATNVDPLPEPPAHEELFAALQKPAVVTRRRRPR